MKWNLKDKLIKKGIPNYWPLVLEGSLFFGGVAFLGSNTVVPLFIRAFGGSMATIGALLMTKSLIQQCLEILAGPFVPYIKDKKKYVMMVMMILRPLPMLMPIVLLFGFGNQIVIITFFIIYVGVWSANGFCVTAWSDLFARTVPDSQRSNVYGNQLVIGGIFGVLCGVIVTYCMGRSDISNNVMFSILFGVGGAILAISSLMMVKAKDIEHKVKPLNGQPLKALIDYYTSIPSYWKKSKSFRIITLSRILNAVGFMIFPFVYLMAKDVFGLSGSYLALLVTMNIIGGILAGITWRKVGQIWGHRGIIVISQYLLFALPILLIIALPLKEYVFLVFIIMAIIQIFIGHIIANWIGYSNYLLQVVSDEERPKYLVLSGLVRLPFAIFPLIGGLMVDKWGYWPLAIVVLIISIGSILVSHTMPKVSFRDSEAVE